MNKKSWDGISSEYDRNVEENKDPIITNYLQKEMNIVSHFCKIIRKKTNKNCSIIDMGSGTGRILFSLDKTLKDNSMMFYGIDNSEQMINKANQKRLLNNSKNQNMKFLKHDLTDPNLCELFEQDTTNIIVCMYNTIGVIPPNRRATFIDSMSRLAGRDGLVIISAFNGDDFGFAAPKLYIPMKEMVKQIDDDSFDEKNIVFKNSLGYHSQWFTKKELKELLQSEVEPIPIDVLIDDKLHTLGHVFVNREP